MLRKIGEAVSATAHIAGMIGWRWALTDRWTRAFGVREVMRTVPGLSTRVAIRAQTSDMFEFNHLLGRDSRPFDLPLDPEYIIDAGANVGYSALRFKLDYPDVKIVAVEPEGTNAAQLRKNLRAYPDVEIEQAALWPESTRLRITNPDGDQCAFVVASDPNGNIRAVTIPELMVRHGFPNVDVLKIDIEGSEKVLFEGNTSWLERVSILLVETHDRMVPGCKQAIDNAVAGRFDYRGIVDEYDCWISTRIVH